MRMRDYGLLRVLIFLVIISRTRIGGRYGLSMTRDISLYIFLIISWELLIHLTFIEGRLMPTKSIV